MLGLIGKKIGMTQLFAEDGTVVPVTAIEAGPCPILQVKTEERDGYRAVQVGFGKKKARRSGKAELAHAARAALDYAPVIVREFRLGVEDRLADDPHSVAEANAPGGEKAEASGEETAAANDTEGAEHAAEEATNDAKEGLRVGQILTVGLFVQGDRVKVTGFTKGRGFQGVIKRHGFAGRPKTHGHPSVRIPGSLGAGTDPSRVIKGRKMSGQMGNERSTNHSLRVAKVDAERNLLFVRGSVPGARNGWVFVSKR